MPSNSSYISDSTQYDELWNYLDQQHIYELLAPLESAVETTLTDALDADQQDRLNAALNLGRSWIDTSLRELYDVDDLTESDAPAVIKDLNARLAQHFLEKRRYRAGEAPTESLGDLKSELLALSAEGSPYSLPWTRLGGIAAAVDSKATQFDKVGQFDNIIPSSDDNVIWPDLANEP